MRSLRPSFAEQDRIEAARREKASELGSRVEALFRRHFSPDELYFLWNYGGVDLPLVREAIQRARNN